MPARTSKSSPSSQGYPPSPSPSESHDAFTAPSQPQHRQYDNDSDHHNGESSHAVYSDSERYYDPQGSVDPYGKRPLSPAWLNFIKDLLQPRTIQIQTANISSGMPILQRLWVVRARDTSPRLPLSTTTVVPLAPARRIPLGLPIVKYRSPRRKSRTSSLILLRSSDFSEIRCEIWFATRLLARTIPRMTDHDARSLTFSCSFSTAERLGCRQVRRF
jgi:hypothetical protein